MNVLYVGSEGRLKETLLNAAGAAHLNVNVKVALTGKAAVIEFLNHNNRIDYIIVDCSLKDIRCLAMVDFILKNTDVQSSQLIVIGYKFDEIELAKFSQRGIKCLTYSLDLADIQNYFHTVFESWPVS